MHALLQVERQKFGDRTVAREQAIDIGADRAVRSDLRRRHEQKASVASRKQLAVEQVGGDGIGNADLGIADDDGLEVGADGRGESRNDARLIDPRALVAEKNVAMADGDHIVVKDAGVDHFRALLRKHRMRSVEAMAARDRLACLERLPRRVLPWTTR